MPARVPRRILITGAKGFVGQHLLTILQGAAPEAELHISSFDVTDKGAVTRCIRETRPDACVHLAAISAVPTAQADPDLAWRVNLGGTLNLAGALVAEAPGSTLLYISTADAYGSSFKLGVKLTEAAALNPINIYGATKAAADLALGAMACPELRVIRARPFNHTGPGQSDAFVIAAFARQLARIEAGRQPPVLRVGALDPYRDFLDVRDVCSCYVQCLLQAETIPTGTILNIASGHPRRIRDVLDELQAISGVKADIDLDTARLRRSEIALAAGDPARALDMLGWAPAIAWQQTLTDTLAYWRTRIGAEPG